jgi:OmpA-OmpF porin, OOP family
MFPIRSLAAAACACLSTVTVAASPPWYAGVSGGEARTSRDLVSNRESTITNATDIATAFDARDSAWKAFGGYRFNETLAIEASYADLGRHTMLTTMLGGEPPLPASIRIARKINGYGADVVFSVPVGGSFSLFGRAGAFRSRLRAEAEVDGNINFSNGDPEQRVRSTTANETLLRYGAGGEWWPRPNLALRLEWERYSKVGKAFAIGGSGTTGEADTDVFWLGVLARF